MLEDFREVEKVNPYFIDQWHTLAERLYFEIIVHFSAVQSFGTVVAWS